MLRTSVLCLLLFLTIYTRHTCAIESCPKPATHCSLEAQHNDGVIHLTIKSITEETFTLYWVDTDCTEKSWGQIVHGASIVVSTYPGHLWRAKSTMDDAVVFEYVVTTNAARGNGDASDDLSKKTREDERYMEVDDCSRREDLASAEIGRAHV